MPIGLTSEQKLLDALQRQLPIPLELRITQTSIILALMDTIEANNIGIAKYFSDVDF